MTSYSEKSEPFKWDPMEVPHPLASSSIQRSLDAMAELLGKKNSDYRISGEFSNFEFAAEISGLSAVDVMLTQIGIKLGRLKGAEGSYHMESTQDTIRDLAGYAIILDAYINHKES